MWLRQRAARLPRIRKSTDASWKPPFGSKYEIQVWLAPPDYGQRLRADVICFTYHDLVFSRCQPGIACAARFNRASEDSAGRDSLERLHRVDLDQAVWDLTERPPCLNQISNCELVHTRLRSFGTENTDRAEGML